MCHQNESASPRATCLSASLLGGRAQARGVNARPASERREGARGARHALETVDSRAKQREQRVPPRVEAEEEEVGADLLTCEQG